MENTLYIHPFHRRLPLAPRFHICRRLGRNSTPPTTITLPRPSNARPHRRPLPHLRLPRHFPPLRNLLHGKYYGRQSPPGRSMVHPHGSRRLHNLHLRGPSPASPSRHHTHNPRRHIMDHRAAPVCPGPARGQLLGVHLPVYDRCYGWY